MYPEFIFRNSNPAVFGVSIEGGTLYPKVQVITDKAEKVGRIHQIQDKGQTIEKADKGSEAAISIRGIEVGRDIKKDETLFVKVPESHVRQLMAKFLNDLTTDTKDVLREYIKLMREKEHPWWGM